MSIKNIVSGKLASITTYSPITGEIDNISTIGNVIASYIDGNGSMLTGLYNNTDVANYLPTYTGSLPSLTGDVTTVGNVSSAYLFANISAASGFPQMYSNIDAAAYLPTYTGTLANLQSVSVVGDVTAANFVGNGSALTGMYGDSNVATYMANYTGNVSGNFIGNGSALTSLNGANVTGTVANANYAAFSGVADSANTVAGANVTGTVASATVADSANTVAGANVTGEVAYAAVANTVAGANVTGEVAFAATANTVAGANVTGQVANALVSGTVYTAAQPNITSAGNTFSAGNVTLTSLNVSTDTVITGNLTVSGTATITGNISQVSGNSGQFFGDASGFGALYAGTVGGVANIANSPLEISTNANTYAQLNMQNINSGTRASSDFVATADNGTDSSYFLDLGIASSTYSYPDYSAIGPNDAYLLAVGDGIDTGVSNIANLLLVSTNGAVKTAVGGSNVEHVSTIVNHANTTAVDGASGTFVVVGDAGIGGNIVAVGNVAASYFLGNGSQLTGLPAGYSDSNVTTLLASGITTDIYTTGNISSNNSTIGHLVIDGSNSSLSTNNGQRIEIAERLNLTADLHVGGNIAMDSAGDIGTAGNVYATYLHGDGSNITGISGSSYTNANVAAYLPTYTGNIGNVGNSVGNLFVAKLLNSDGTSFVTVPTYEAWIDPTVGSDTNPGTLAQPWKTIAHAQSEIGNSKYVLNLLAGDYNETITWTQTNVTIVGPGAGDLVRLMGAWTFNLTAGTSVRIYGVKFTDVTIAGFGGTYFTECSLDGNISITGDGATEFNICALEDSGAFFITNGANGQAYTTVLNSTFSDLTINNANAVVSFENSQSTNSLITLQAGVALLTNCDIVSTTPGDMVLNSSIGTTVIANGSTFADIDGSSAAVTIGGNWSFSGVNYDVVNSIISGTNFGEATFTDAIVSFKTMTAGTTFTAVGGIINSRVVPRSTAITSSATITPTGDASDQYNVTALAAAATIAAPTGTPTNGQKLTIRIKDNGTARALTWNAIYRVIGTTLPVTTVASKTVYVGVIYNSTDTKWDVVSVAQEA